jgi:hypothetical protein
MATHITLADAKAWTELTKVGANFTSIDADLESQVSSQIIARLSQRFSTVSWIDNTLTPLLVKTIIAMYYVSYVYDKTYSTDVPDLAAYAILLRQQAEFNLTGLLAGNIDLPEVPGDTDFNGPSFYPNDASSALEPTCEDSSLGPAKFSMGTTW